MRHKESLQHGIDPLIQVGNNSLIQLLRGCIEHAPMCKLRAFEDIFQQTPYRKLFATVMEVV